MYNVSIDFSKAILMLGFQGTLGKLPNITGPSSSLKGQ
jgi:hypothetical protein